MNPIGALILAVLMAVVVFAPRRMALLGMMAGVIYLTQEVTVQIGGFNMFATRFLELAGFVRVMSRREFSFLTLNKVDWAFIWLHSYVTIVFLLRSSDGQAYVIGMAVDAFLCYFTFRGLIGDLEDFRWFLCTFIFLLAPFALLVLIESFTVHNPFTVLGAPEAGDWMRNGRPRCFGSFRQPDTLGMFAASFIPLYVGLACLRKERFRALLGLCLCFIIVWAANAGGAASGAMVGLVCWGFWRFRMQMRKVRWGIVAILTLLALVMKAPIWYIFAHASSITGGDGWHRSYLIDVSYRHLGQWWFAGMAIADTVDWFPYYQPNTGGADITNQFIAFGLNAGLGATILFIFLLQRTFSGLGNALAAVRSSSTGTSEAEFFFWGFGALLVVHIVDWFGVTYFDQMYVVWFMQLAAVSSLSEHCLKAEASVPSDVTVDETTTIQGHQSGIVVEC